MQVLKVFFSIGLVLIVTQVPAFAQDSGSATTVKQDPMIQSAVNYAHTELDQSSHYSSNLKLREDRKIGLGTQLGGGLGVAGLDLEINVDAENSVVAGVGTGTGYGTFQVLWRHSFEGPYLTPYTTAGWSRWYNSSSPSEYKNSLILDRVLNDSDRASGRFGVDFLTVSAGMQYHQLSGDLMGLSFFAEFALLSAFSNPSIIPTGTLGSIYYF